jgi:hypothetical protein
MLPDNIDFTPAFESYWNFAAKRHSIYEKRLREEEPPWTEDPILQEYKFTDVFSGSGPCIPVLHQGGHL